MKNLKGFKTQFETFFERLYRRSLETKLSSYILHVLLPPKGQAKETFIYICVTECKHYIDLMCWLLLLVFGAGQKAVPPLPNLSLSFLTLGSQDKISLCFY